ncbi:hypothetical protein Lal_00047525 [Lupinus albus]|nr:hypothetical protein Lal_00047525 [Lupinus albus]
MHIVSLTIAGSYGGRGNDKRQNQRWTTKAASDGDGTGGKNDRGNVAIPIEGLAGLKRQSTSLGFFTPYTVGSDNISISMLQYVDDVILIGYCSDQNIWAMKSIMKFPESRLGKGARYPSVVGVVRSIQKLQRNFLWGEVNNKGKINWLKWEEVCNLRMRDA